LVPHAAVRAAQTAHPTAGEDQAAMVRDVCQRGQGAAIVAVHGASVPRGRVVAGGVTVALADRGWSLGRADADGPW
jgi:hypothetical protein